MRWECNLLKRAKKRSTSSSAAAMVKSTKQYVYVCVIAVLQRPHTAQGLAGLSSALTAVGVFLVSRSLRFIRTVMSCTTSTDSYVEEHEK
jgi:hypothetical protein